jgi:hypothetical protein
MVKRILIDYDYEYRPKYYDHIISVKNIFVLIITIPDKYAVKKEKINGSGTVHMILSLG